MCVFNSFQHHAYVYRYYVAEGVRSYAQETWQLAMGGRGRLLVARHIQQVLNPCILPCRVSFLMLQIMG
jgi:hypothetical protein